MIFIQHEQSSAAKEKGAIPSFGTAPFYIRGGARRDRTADLLNAIQALSQLSYSPTNGLSKFVTVN